MYGSFAVLVLAASLTTGLLVHQRMEESLLKGLQASLEEKCVILQPLAERYFRGMTTPETGDVQQEVAHLGEITQTRITWIEPDGKVMADSQENPAVMDNHESRPEVRRALTSGMGNSRRYSQTLNVSMLYVARAVRQGNKVLGVVRVAVPLEGVDAQVSSLGWTIAGGAALGALAALLLGVLVARRMTAPIVEMARLAKHLRQGEAPGQAQAVSEDEMGVLAETLSHLEKEVGRQIALLSKDRTELEAILAGMVEGVIAIDKDEKVLFFNQAACRLLGIENLSPSGPHLWEQIRVPGLLELLGKARSKKQGLRQEMLVPHATSEMVLDAHATPFESEGTSGLVIVLHDISDLRRLERVRRDFVANVSHELKTPLTAIRGYVETLMTGALHDEEKNVRFLEKIQEHVQRLTRLVEDLLRLAHIESQEGLLRRGPVDWIPLVEDAVQRREIEILHKGLECQVDLPPEPVMVVGDREAMVQVLDNLLDNAIKYTTSPGKIFLRVVEESSRGRLDVSDSGIGIPRKDLDRIFERFYRVDKARSREAEGTGLGLAIVKHLLQSMEGEIRVESEEGRGSRFTVLLPLVATSPPADRAG